MFKILGHDQQEYGPVSADVLRQWIAERRANAQTMVQAGGTTEFKPLGQFPEFQAALAAVGSTGTPSVVVTTPPEKPSTGLAVTSLILGILSFCFLFITAIPAVITGHMALGRIRREPEKHGGKGMAIAGLVLGYFGLALLVPFFLAGLTLPALAKAKAKAQRISCVNNMKQVALAARIYANNHNELLPPNISSLSNDLPNLRVLVCPADQDHTVATDWSSFSDTENVTYEYLMPGANENQPQKVMFRCAIHNNVALADGSVVQAGPGRF
jgi:hypothetical protein